VARARKCPRGALCRRLSAHPSNSFTTVQFKHPVYLLFVCEQCRDSKLNRRRVAKENLGAAAPARPPHKGNPAPKRKREGGKEKRRTTWRDGTHCVRNRPRRHERRTHALRAGTCASSRSTGVRIMVAIHALDLFLVEEKLWMCVYRAMYSFIHSLFVCFFLLYRKLRRLCSSTSM
jgi:hypothetical protein